MKPVDLLFKTLDGLERLHDGASHIENQIVLSVKDYVRKQILPVIAPVISVGATLSGSAEPEAKFIEHMQFNICNMRPNSEARLPEFISSGYDETLMNASRTHRHLQSVLEAGCRVLLIVDKSCKLHTFYERLISEFPDTFEIRVGEEDLSVVHLKIGDSTFATNPEFKTLYLPERHKKVPFRMDFTYLDPYRRNSPAKQTLRLVEANRDNTAVYDPSAHVLRFQSRATDVLN